ncbi:MAG TPA: PPC domain-containing DNA-binding protein [Pyrinomonadaceae bacterium]|nr:PPC domain-containing DNA-binding protein [Pyrinomonadaceae bacterium]
MKSKLLHDGGEKTFVLVFDTGDEVVAGLLDFAKEHKLAASMTAIGAFERATLGFFESERKDYKKIHINEQVEVMSLIGNIALDESGQPKVHAHVVVGRRDGTAHGGHLLEAYVRPTLEVILVESPEPLRRKMNAEVGLPLIDLTE